MGFLVHSGLVAGRHHVLDAKNCQDALCSLSFEHEGQGYHVGVIADGCGEGNYSETGAELAVQFTLYEIKRVLRQGVAVSSVPAFLFENLLRFLRGLLNSYAFADVSERLGFVQHHLLFTLIGFMIGPEDTVVFAAGDGLIVLNEEQYLREQNNTPTYIGYHLIDTQRVSTALPAMFDVYHVPTKTLNRLAIGSDAWFQEQALLDAIWGVKTPAGLQLLMNRWSNARHLKDDASLIVVERVSENPSAVQPGGNV